MNIDIEKLRNELKNKVDEIIDLYINDDNEIIQIPQDKIYMEFELNGKNYIAFSDNPFHLFDFCSLYTKIETCEESRGNENDVC